MIGDGDGRPRAILFRQIATPNYELRRFLRICARSGFDPVILQYHTDRMSCQNPCKRALVAPMFIEGISRNGQPFFRRHSLINVETVEQLRLCDVSIANRPLPDFHADLMRLVLPDGACRTVDGSSFFGSFPNGARDYYVDLFTTLTGNLLLFEDFASDAKEADFFARVVQPAFATACRILGQRPMIIRLCDNRRMESPLWYAYPASYRAHFAALGCKL